MILYVLENWERIDGFLMKTRYCIQNHTTVVQNCNTGQDLKLCSNDAPGQDYAENMPQTWIMPIFKPNVTLCRKLCRPQADSPSDRFLTGWVGFAWGTDKSIRNSQALSDYSRVAVLFFQSVFEFATVLMSNNEELRSDPACTRFRPRPTSSPSVQN